MKRHSSFTVLPNLLPETDPRYKKWRMSLKKRPAVWNKGRTKEIDVRVKRISKTFKKKKLDNLRAWREEARKEGLIPDTSKPLKRTKELAFLIGIILGDGNIQQFPRTQSLNITLGTDKPSLWKYIAKTIENVFNKKPAVYFRKNSNCLDIRIYQKNLNGRLRIPVGSKKSMEFEIPKWIWEQEYLLISYLKGLFEAEGSFSVHKKTYTYNFSFSNRNLTLLDEVEKSLTNLGFHPERRKYAVRLRRKNEAMKFKKIISFRKYP